MASQVTPPNARQVAQWMATTLPSQETFTFSSLPFSASYGSPFNFSLSSSFSAPNPRPPLLNKDQTSQAPNLATSDPFCKLKVVPNSQAQELHADTHESK